MKCAYRGIIHSIYRGKNPTALFTRSVPNSPVPTRLYLPAAAPTAFARGTPTHPSEVRSNCTYSEDLPKSPRLGRHYEATLIGLDVAVIVKIKTVIYSPSKELLESWQGLKDSHKTEQ